jgi:hypothetical protein
MQKVVKNADGRDVTVVADTEKELNEAVKQARKEGAPVYPNINHPVQKGHDLVAVDGEVNRVLVDGTGAHNSPYDAVKPFSQETDSDVDVPGLDEPAYKVSEAGHNDVAPVVVPSESEVTAAKKEAEKNDETTESK